MRRGVGSLSYGKSWQPRFNFLGRRATGQLCRYPLGFSALGFRLEKKALRLLFNTVSCIPV